MAGIQIRSFKLHLRPYALEVAKKITSKNNCKTNIDRIRLHSENVVGSRYLSEIILEWLNKINEELGALSDRVPGV